MAYVRSKRNIRRPRRARRSVRRRTTRASYPRRRTTTRTYQRRKQPCVCPGELTPGAKFALAQMDPFEPNCLGAKVPDSNTMPSIANADTDQVALAGPATAGNLVAFCFQPNYGYASQEATPGATSVSWSASSWNPRRNYLNVVNSIEAIRPLAHAIRISSSLAPTSATGFVHIGLSVESRIADSTSSTSPGFPTTVNAMSGLAYYKRVTLASLTQSPLTVINKWIDELGFRYDDPRVVNTFTVASSGVTTPQTAQQVLNMSSSWATIVVMIEGAPTGGAPLSAEHILLTECLPKKDSFILGTQAAPNSPGTMSAVSSMSSSTDFAHTEAGQESYIQQSMNAFAQGANVAGERVFQQVALPLIQQAGYAAVGTAATLAMNAIRGTGGIPGVNSNPSRLAIT